MSDRVLALVAEGEGAARELPLPVIAYFLITFALFLVALGVTWSFRNTAYKVQAPRPARPPRARTAARADPTGPTTDHAPRRHGWDVRPDPPRSPRGRQRGRSRGSSSTRSSSCPPVSRGRRPTREVTPGRGPLPHDRHRDGLQPAVHRQPGRHRPRRPDLHDRHPARPARASGPTPSCSSSPVPTRWPRSCRGRTPRSCSSWRTSSGSPGPGYDLSDAGPARRTGSRLAGGAGDGDQLHRLPGARRAAANRSGTSCPTASSSTSTSTACMPPGSTRRRTEHEP